MPRPSPKDMSVEDLIKELDIDRNSKHTKRLLLGDTARLMELAGERHERRMLKQSQEIDLHPLKSFVSEEKAQLKFILPKPGVIICGRNPTISVQQTPMIANESQQKRSSDLGSTIKHGGISSSAPLTGINKRSDSLRNIDPEPDKSLLLKKKKSEQDDDENQYKVGVNGERGQWKRVTAERYVDCYLNGGKYEPPAQSLMEAGIQ
jgi:hypothetical protein